MDLSGYTPQGTHPSRQPSCPLNRRLCRMIRGAVITVAKVHFCKACKTVICMLQAPRKRTDIKYAASVSRCRRTHACIYPSRHAEETICKRIPGAGRHPCRTLYNLISPDCCQDSPSAGFSWSCRIPPVSPPSRPG